ncbi:MAG: aminotransferase class I/II-fold pyridoxal phosphate-dependent enzyme [Syntrophales bacterium]|nr:aminotransferase class I/II-fold pyridoxal phosphate-dependent enzyme [Syntrophales bacterium]
MTLAVSDRHAWVMQSEIRNMTIECNKVGGINLAQGVCDTGVPPEVRRGAEQAMEAGINIYTNYAGLIELREAIAAKQQRFTGMIVDPQTEIIATAGATGAFYCTCLALLNPGDEVIVFEPYYGYHINTIVATGAVPAYLRMSPPAWSFSRADLERVKTPKTRALLVNTPGNPSGKVFSEAELQVIAGFAKDNDLFVFTDEIYEHFLYDGNRHIALATLPGMKERTITISGLSKTFSITGWRIGYCLADARWAKIIGYFNDLIYVCAPAPLQIGVARGLMELGADYYQGLSAEYLIKRDKICDALTRAGLAPHIPGGSYYVLADVSNVPGKSSKEKAMHLLQQTGVAGVPGSAFYHDDGGDNLVRFCFAKDDDVLDDACHRLFK